MNIKCKVIKVIFIDYFMHTTCHWSIYVQHIHFVFCVVSNTLVSTFSNKKGNFLKGNRVWNININKLDLLRETSYSIWFLFLMYFGTQSLHCNSRQMYSLGQCTNKWGGGGGGGGGEDGVLNINSNKLDYLREIQYNFSLVPKDYSEIVDKCAYWAYTKKKG